MRILLILAVLVGTLAPARAGILEPFLRSKLTKFPQCHDEKVRADIIERFNRASDEAYDRPTVMTAIPTSHERATLTTRPEYPDRLIPRRYCRGTAVVDNIADHRKPFHVRVDYMIEQGQGLAGTGWEVFFCLDPYDEWNTYDAHCRALRRFN